MPQGASTTQPDARRRGNLACSSTREAAATGSAVERATAEVFAALAGGATVAVCCERTTESVLAAVGVTYLAHAEPHRVRLVATDEAQVRIGEKIVTFEDGDDDSVVALAKRVFTGFEKRCGTICARRVVLACASDESGMPEIVHRYLRLGFSEGKRLYEDVAAPEALAFAKLAQRVSSECEHTRQFVRFARLPDGTFVSVFEPNENTLPLVGTHFARRMREDRFVVVDPGHLVAIFHEPPAPSWASMRTPPPRLPHAWTRRTRENGWSRRCGSDSIALWSYRGEEPPAAGMTCAPLGCPSDSGTDCQS